VAFEVSAVSMPHLWYMRSQIINCKIAGGQIFIGRSRKQIWERRGDSNNWLKGIAEVLTAPSCLTCTLLLKENVLGAIIRFQFTD
jgi:hypothetical protein